MTAWRTALAPAKLNLRLEVLGKRADGFHELDTDMLSVDLCDELRARAIDGSDLRLSLSGPQCSDDIPSDERNLVFRAARLVQAEAQRRGVTRCGLELELVKHIPSQAGLGGASSDAVAGMLVAAAALDLAIDHEWFGDQAARLGSDCRYFNDATHGRARCTGRGELVEPFDGPRPAWWIALATPEAHCPTPLVFGALRFPLPRLQTQAPFGAGRDAGDGSLRLGNQLQEAAFEACPELADWRALFDGTRVARWQLSGSGSSVFRLFSSRESAQAALAGLRAGASERGLTLRFSAVVRPAGHGARVMG